MNELLDVADPVPFTRGDGDGKPATLGQQTAIAAWPLPDVAFQIAALIGLLSLSEPVFASTVALVVFSEVPTSLGVVGMVVVLAAIAAVVTSKDA